MCMPKNQDEVKADQNYSKQTGKEADTCKERSKEKVKAKADQETNMWKIGEQTDQEYHDDVGVEADTSNDEQDAARGTGGAGDVGNDPVHQDDPVPAAVRDTQPITLCPTRTGPVARYVKFQLDQIDDHKLILKHPGHQGDAGVVHHPSAGQAGMDVANQRRAEEPRAGDVQ